MKLYVVINMLLLCALNLYSQSSNNWVATDALGRGLPDYQEVGSIREGKYVGVFYWLWHGYIRTDPIKNVTEELQQNPYDPQWSFLDWYWAEPEAGYYHSSDTWVARRNLQMLANAGVDFIYLDYTNGPIGEQSFDNFMQVAQEMLNNGIPVPKFVFFLNANASETMQGVYNDIYEPEKYKDLWFYWEGKPLMMESQDKAPTQEIKDFFTFRDSWAWQQDSVDQWRFIDNYPQTPSYHNGSPEQICVSKGIGSPLWLKGDKLDKGASFYDNTVPDYNEYWLCEDTPKGLFFKEQWQRALEVDPPIVCVTGWNEWTAGAWHMDSGQAESYMFMGEPLDEDPEHWYFVDQFNKEFNRDIAPMKGGYTDNYYYQLVRYVRQYKGMEKPEHTGRPANINIDAQFSDWSDITPEYKDAPGDIMHRNCKNVNNSDTYVNTTGRNDILHSKVTYDSDNLYFYVETANTLTDHTDPNWMLLYLNVDESKSTGWQGFDYMVNHDVINETTTTLKEWSNGSWVEFQSNIEYRASGNKMEIMIPKEALGINSESYSFRFQWHDSPRSLADISEVFLNGDAAPDRRFNYRFVSDGSVSVPSFSGAWHFDNGTEGWGKPKNNVDITVSGSILDVSITGDDPWFYSGDNLDISAGDYTHAVITMQNQTSDNSGQVFWQDPDGNHYSQSFSINSSDDAMRDYVIDLSSNSDWAGTIRRLRLDPTTASSGSVKIDRMFLARGYPEGNIPELPVSIEAENFIDAPQGFAYHDMDTANLGGEHRSEGVDIIPVPDGYAIGFINPGEWLDYIVNVPDSGDYELTARVASPFEGKSFHVKCDGIQVTESIACPVTGEGDSAWMNFEEVTETVSLPAGMHVLQIYMETAGFNLDDFGLKPAETSVVKGHRQNESGMVLSYTPGHSPVISVSMQMDADVSGAEFIVYDSKGKAIIRDNISQTGAEGRRLFYEKDLKGLSSGVYYGVLKIDDIKRGVKRFTVGW